MSGLLNHSPAEITQRQLVSGSFGTLPSASSTWPIFLQNEQDSPDSCITIYDTLGETEGTIQIDGKVVERYSIQIRLRSGLYETAYTKAQAIQQYLDKTIKQTSITIGSDTYLITDYIRRQPILRIGKDIPQSKREILVINYLLKVNKT